MKGIAETGVLITGGCGDIGRAVAKRFLEAGARVVIADLLPLTRGRAVARSLDAKNACYVRCDVTEAASLDSAFKEALQFLGKLDTVICNAGFVANSPFTEVTEKDWEKTLDVNLTGSFLTAQRGAHHAQKSAQSQGTAGHDSFYRLMGAGNALAAWRQLLRQQRRPSNAHQSHRAGARFGRHHRRHRRTGHRLRRFDEDNLRS